MFAIPKKIVLKSIIFFSFFTLGFIANAQELKEEKNQTYIITDNAGIADVQPYIDALNISDMKYHRLLNKRHTIVFQTGVKVELFSASEISKSGKSMNLSEYPEAFDPSRQEPVFALGANNFIIEYHTSTNKQNKILSK